MKPIPYGKQFIDDEDIKAVVDVLKSDFLTQGPKVKEFEQEFAKKTGTKYAVAVANGTAALHLSNLAIGISEGDKVLTTPISFVATSNSVLYCGGKVDFVDIDSKTYTIDIDKLEQKINSASQGTYKAIIPVDLAGYPVNMEKIKKIADKHGLKIIEDACHAPGGYFVDSKGNKQTVGNCAYSDLAIFSFHPVKHIAAGEGGMITTNNEELYHKLIELRTHGITKNPQKLTENHGGWYYEMHSLGFNYRLSDIHSALGLTQLRKLDKSVQRRQEIAEKYNKAFSSNPKIKIPFATKSISHAYHLYIIQVPDRKGLYDYLKQNNIFAQVHYIPIHLQPFYRKLGWKKGDLPVAEDYYDHALSLPMYPTLTEEEQDYVIEKVLEFVK